MGDLTEDEVNEILDSGDPDQINQLLESMEETEEGFQLKNSDDEPEGQGEPEVKENSEEPEAGNADEAEGDQPDVLDGHGEGETPYIEGKHGKHKIPYDVLENERKARQEAENKLRDMESQLGDKDKLQRQMDLLTQQLEEAGLDPEVLPEDIKLTDEMKLMLTEDFGAAGKMMIAMKERMDQLEQELNSSNQPVEQNSNTDAVNDDPVMSAISRNETLESWRTGSEERWREAVRVDQILQTDPNFKDSSLDERFAEAVKRVQTMYGDEPASGTSSDNNLSDQDADQKIKQAKEEADSSSPVPASLSEMGAGASTVERPLVERLQDMDIEDIQAQMENMSQSQRDKLLAQLD